MNPTTGFSKYEEVTPEKKAQIKEQAESLANRCRFGVVNTLFHQQPHTPAFTVEARFTRFLDSDEQPYQRRLTLTEDWQKLDYGWLAPDRVAVLVIKNEEGRYLTIPTQEEKDDMARRTIHLGHKIGDVVAAYWLVRPGECFQGEPFSLEDFYLRSAKGKIRCTITIIPS